MAVADIGQFGFQLRAGSVGGGQLGFELAVAVADIGQLRFELRPGAEGGGQLGLEAGMGVAGAGQLRLELRPGAMNAEQLALELRVGLMGGGELRFQLGDARLVLGGVGHGLRRQEDLVQLNLQFVAQGFGAFEIAGDLGE